MKRWLNTFMALGAMLLFLLVPAFAQQNSSVRGSLTGVVFDETGSVLPNASVHIEGPQGNYQAKTDSFGRFQASSLVPGSYTVKVEAPGFKSFISEKNLVTAGVTSTLDLHLQVGAVTDTVQVEAGSVQIDTQSTALSTPLTDQLYESLPLARNVSGIFALAAGVVSGGATDTKGNGTNPSIGGASGLENLYLVDGVNVTDQAFGGFGTFNRFFGALGTGVNLAFIKEVDIKTTAFEPQFGKAAGGIVEIVTKSGSNKYHGAIAAYAGPGAWYAERNQTCLLGYTTTAPNCHYADPQYDISGELGGYVPGLKDKLFFFGAFDPTVSEEQHAAQPGQPIAGKTYTESLNERSWAGKLSYEPFAKTQIEASSFGDPSFTNSIQATYNSANDQNSRYRYNFGDINSVLRVNQTITPTWIVNASYMFNISHFSQTNKFDSWGIQDRSVSPFISYYVGGYEPTKNNDYSINVDTSKIVNFAGQHTFSVGYTYEHTNFVDKNLRSGAYFPIPGTNITGAAMNYGAHQSAVGQLTNAFFRLMSDATSDCTYCAKNVVNGTTKYVYLRQYRAGYAGFNTVSTSRYHVLWGNDNWQIGRHINVGLGLRWEEQWFGGALANYLFNDNWSPRLGINWDPMGDHKTKVFFNYARYQAVLPLDAAIRQLGNEQDDTNLYFVPKTDAAGFMLRDSLSAPAVSPDKDHLLNGTQKTASAKFGAVNFASSSVEGILPGTKMEYENEYVFGIQRAIAPGMMLGARYTDRRLGRVIEDIGSQSPETSATGMDQFWGGIGNVNAATDISINENLAVYTPAQWAAANGTLTPGTVDATTYKPPVPGCKFGNDTSVANGDFFRGFDGSAYNGDCLTNDPAVAGSVGKDGKPDGFANPERKYQEFVVEFARNMKNNWQARANFRYARLFGNYEGFFRNDNGQSDPGISSLFDFTQGSINLLGDQFKPGLLNTDRRMVANIDVSYQINDKTRFISGVRGLNVGANLRGQSGSPLSAYASHPVYGNQGEIPIGGRGTKGTLPSVRQVDMHADYPWKIRESWKLKFAFDAFNVTNSKFVTNRNQFLDQSPGLPNPDYNKVGCGTALACGYQAPFHARASVKIEF
jgi:outer membrane receptor for ferrienterochelin and colicin